MRRKMDQMQREVNEFMSYVKREMTPGLDGWEERLGTALVKTTPSSLVRAAPQTSEESNSSKKTVRRKRLPKR